MARTSSIPSIRSALCMLILRRLPIAAVVVLFGAGAVLGDNTGLLSRIFFGTAAVLGVCDVVRGIRGELRDPYFVEVVESELIFHSIATGVFREPIVNFRSVEIIQGWNWLPRDYLFYFRLTSRTGEHLFLTPSLLSEGALAWLARRAEQGETQETPQGVA